SNLTATAASASQINLAWSDNSANETQFKIERSSDGVSFTQTTTVAANVTTYSNTGLAAGTQYYYRVRANNAAGDSAYSNVANATTSTSTSTTPAAPSNLTGSAASGREIDLNWTDNSASPTVATSFKLFRSTDNVTFDWFATTGQGVTSFAWTGATPSTTYYFRVIASGSAGDSAASNTASGATMAVAAAPSR